MTKTEKNSDRTNNQLIPRPLLLGIEGEQDFAPSFRKRGGRGGEFEDGTGLKGFRLEHWNLELGIYLEFGICDLEFFFPSAVCRRPYAENRS
jgi:hypothetical protein